MRRRGFTLIELIVVMGIIAVLAAIVIIAVNPARQLAQARNSDRTSDVATIAKAIGQYVADGGTVTAITATPKLIGTTAGAEYVDLTNILIPKYVSAIPVDPSGGSTANTGYTVYIRDSGQVVVDAPRAELQKLVSSGTGTNYALQFDGVDDRITIPHSSALSINNNLTIELWFYAANEVVGYATNPLRKHFSTSDANFVLYYFGTTSGTNRRIGFYGTRGGVWSVISGNYTVNLNQWYHVAVGYNSATGGQLYINGSPVGSRSGGGILTTNTQPIYAGLGLDGKLDDLRIYNTELTAEQIAAHYNEGIGSIGGPESNLVGGWRLDEGAGLSAYDYSGNAGTGILSGGAVWVNR